MSIRYVGWLLLGSVLVGVAFGAIRLALSPEITDAGLVALAAAVACVFGGLGWFSLQHMNKSGR